MLNIKRRFIEEVEKISAYTNLINSMSKLPPWREVSSNLNKLYIFAMESDNLLHLLELYDYPDDTELIESIIEEARTFLLNYIESIIENSKQLTINEQKSQYYDEDFIIMINENFYDADYYDFISIFSESTGIDNLINFYKERYKIKFKRFEHIGPNEENIQKIIEYDLENIANEAVKLSLEHVCTESEDVLVFFDRLKTILEINDSNNTLNVYRQSFILLISSFDAAIFDITKELLNQRFFSLISKFCDNDQKIRVKDLDKFVDSSGMIENTIDECLKKKYLKDLFRDYNGLGIINDDVLFKELMEITNRRNVHLHKAGIADEQYVSSFNLYSKIVDEYLEISEAYLEKSIDVCIEFITKLVDWYNSDS